MVTLEITSFIVTISIAGFALLRILRDSLKILRNVLKLSGRRLKVYSSLSLLRLHFSLQVMVKNLLNFSEITMIVIKSLNLQVVNLQLLISIVILLSLKMEKQLIPLIVLKKKLKNRKMVLLIKRK